MDKKFSFEEVKILIKAFHLDSREGCYDKEQLEWCNNWIKTNIVDVYDSSQGCSCDKLISLAKHKISLLEENAFLKQRLIDAGLEKPAITIDYSRHA